DYLGLWSWRGSGHSLTLKQELAQTQKVLAALECARDAIESPPRVGGIINWAGDALAAMAALTTKVKRHHNNLEAAIKGRPHFRMEAPVDGGSSGRSYNARKVHTEYWAALVLLWQTITRQKRQRGLSEFVLACSAPAFPKQTTKKSVRRFLDRMPQ